jgi:hypothetical protein
LDSSVDTTGRRVSTTSVSVQLGRPSCGSKRPADAVPIDRSRKSRSNSKIFQSLEVPSGRTTPTLMKRQRRTSPPASSTVSRTHTPERSLLLITPCPRDSARTSCARRSESGATSSPKAYVRATRIKPTRTTANASDRVLIPDTRMIVNSEFAASCDSAKMAPISAAIGISS